METGSRSGQAKEHPEMERERDDGKSRSLGSMLPKIEPFVPRRTDHNPRELRSWAKRTGFVSNFSGESNVGSGAAADRFDGTRLGGDRERGGVAGSGGSLARQGNDRIVGRDRTGRGTEIEPVPGDGTNVNRNGGEIQMRRGGMDEGGLRGEGKEERGLDLNLNGVANVNGTEKLNVNGNGDGRGVAVVLPAAAESKEDEEKGKEEVEINVYHMEGEEPENGWWSRPPGMRLSLRDKPRIGS